MVTSISDSRIAPVGEDLTTEELGLSIIRGLETMHRVDYPLADGVALVAGEWGVLGATGKLERAGATPASATYLVFAGTDRYDSKATGQATVVQASMVVAKTVRFNTAQSYAPGDLLTVKNLGGGESQLTKHTAGEIAVAKVVVKSGDVLTYETMSPVKVA